MLYKPVYSYNKNVRIYIYIALAALLLLLTIMMQEFGFWGVLSILFSLRVLTLIFEVYLFRKKLHKVGVEFYDSDTLDSTMRYAILVKTGKAVVGVFYKKWLNMQFILEPKYSTIYADDHYFIMVDLDGKYGAYNCETRKIIAECKYSSIAADKQGNLKAYTEDEVFTITPYGTIESRSAR